MYSSIYKLLLVGLCILLLTDRARALPPLGLTLIDATFGDLEIIDGTAFIASPGGIQTVSSAGDLGFIGISHPTLTPVYFTTSVVKSGDGELYVGASFGTFNIPLGGALYDLDQPSTPIVTWEGAYRLHDVSRNLTVFGNAVFDYHKASYFFLDGTVAPLAHPQGPQPNNTFLASATPNGYALGDAGVPGTAGSDTAIWTPSGELSFLNMCCSSSSIRDREGGNDVNIGTDSGAVKYASDARIQIKSESGSGLAAWSVIVSHSNFAVLDDYSEVDSTKYAYYPGINSNFPDRAIPLLDIFPELATIDIDFVSDLASVDGFLYMTLSGSDGTFLFGARDPSVIVPEPATAAILLLCTLPWIGRWSRHS